MKDIFNIVWCAIVSIIGAMGILLYLPTWQLRTGGLLIILGIIAASHAIRDSVRKLQQVKVDR